MSQGDRLGPEVPDLKIISTDDHVIEPPDLWTSRLPSALRDQGPHVVRRRIRLEGQGRFSYDEHGDWSDIWIYEDLQLPVTLPTASAGWAKKELANVPILFEDMRPGCFKPQDRLLDMDINNVEASMCFPNLFVRFCGQTFAEAKDKSLAFLCLRCVQRLDRGGMVWIFWRKACPHLHSPSLGR